MMTGVVTPFTIGRLRIERQLGAGGFATVWLAHDPDLDSAVAVKILAENFSVHADVRRRFIDEARLLRRVDSDHLVRVYDVGELPDGRPFFVMTYADRGSLAERLVHLPPPWPAYSVLAVVDAVAAGLAVLHRHGVVHRDIKPVNILLRTTPDGGERVLLGDLGIAKDLHWASGLTMPAGSSGYAAPEQEGYSERIGPATDVHALAVTAAQLLGLQPPWPPTPLGAALARATDPDPARRTPSALEFAAQFRAGVNTGPPGGPLPPATPTVPVAPMRAPAGPPVAAPPPGPPVAAPPPGPPVAAPPPGPPVAAPPAGPPVAAPPAGPPVAAPPPGPPTGPPQNGAPSMPGPPPGPMPPGPPPGHPTQVMPAVAPTQHPPSQPTGLPLRPGPSSPAQAPAPARPPRWPLAVAAGFVVVLLGAGAAWFWSQRVHRIAPANGRVSIEVPRDWAPRSGVPHPETGDANDGVRAGSGSRSISVAYANTSSDPATVLSRVRPEACTARETRTVRVRTWNGLTDRWTGCPNGSEIHEVVLVSPGPEEWTVWVEVRSVSGEPDVADVLASLEVDPR